MVRLSVLVGLALVLTSVAPAAPHPAALPAAAFQDQEGRTLDLADLRGRIAVIVYGGRAGIEHHVLWGKRIDGELRARGVYRMDDGPAARPVQILALAQMGGIPGIFRPLLRDLLRGRVERGYSLWLDWDDMMSRLFGANDPASTVVVVDRAGAVRLVVSGPPEGPPYKAVSDLLVRLN